MFRTLICPSSGARDYTYVIAAYGVQCLGCWWSAVRSRAAGCCSTPNSRIPATKALHTICGNNTSIVSSSWWWAYECPKHVEQIIIAIKHSVASSWFSSLRLSYDARTKIHQVLFSFCLAFPLFCPSHVDFYFPLTNAVNGSKHSPTLLKTIGLRAPNSSPPLTLQNSPSAPCASAANAIESYTGIINRRSISINDLLVFDTFTR